MAPPYARSKCDADNAVCEGVHGGVQPAENDGEDVPSQEDDGYGECLRGDDGFGPGSEFMDVGEEEESN